MAKARRPDLAKPYHLQLTVSRLMIGAAWPDLRYRPACARIKTAGWFMGAAYRSADWRDYRIMLARTRCPAQGAVAKTIALELQRRR